MPRNASVRIFSLCCASLFFAQVFAAGDKVPAAGGEAKVPPAGRGATQSRSAHNDDSNAKAAPRLDRSGKKRRGKASYYGRQFAGKKMADGTPMNPESSAAASKTLPLGTKAKVTNLKNGRSAVVEIRDRGPYVAGRTIDVTPKTARELGMTKDGVAPVEVAPIEVPQPGGERKQGDGATMADN